MNAVTPTILIMAGGTGGHVFPALTIAAELLARGARVEWLGTRQGLEARVIGNSAIPLHFISIGGLRGKGWLKKLLAPVAITWATLQAMSRIVRVKPQCVLGMGGFVTGPGGVAARLLGKKLLIHEQNAVAGMTNQLLFPLADVVMEAFPGAFARKQALGTPVFLRRRIDTDVALVIGNPVRADILALAPPVERYGNRQGRLRLLVVGGSLGAMAVNRLLPPLLAGLSPDARPLVQHQCGERNLAETRALYAQAGLVPGADLDVCAFIDDMAEAYAWADLIVCRAGASTIAELAAIGLPAVLVPYPYAVDDHQRENARILEEAGAAVVLSQTDLDTDRLAAALAELGDRSRLQARAEAALLIGVRDASERAATLCLEACRG